VAPDGPTFLLDRPSDLRRATPWHRYAHHIRRLPAALAALAPELRVPPRGRVLDYGCADVPYRHLFAADVDFVAADLPGNPHATLELNPDSTVPVPDESFDAVLSTQVLEHVVDPELHLSEGFRVLRPGGRMLLSTHGTFSYHPDPVDYWRWTCAGLRRVVAGAGFQIERFEGVVGMGATGLQLFQESIYYRVPGFVRPLLATVIQALMALADRLEPAELRDMNGSVFALVALRP
jgi:SAM-dependent methyltransferase